MALVWLHSAQMGLAPPRETGPKAKAAALKAIELCDTVAETHFVLAMFDMFSDWDWAGAEREFERAIELNPSFPDARIFYSHLLMITERQEAALRQARRALELDPLNAFFHGLYAGDLLFARR
jgi:tetratricopeptide (TPR) repeat protein